MIELGVDVNDVDSGDGWTPLHSAYGKAIIDLLIEAGANTEAREQGGSTPLKLVIWTASAPS